MLRVGLVGCGKIADAHVSQILRVGGCEIVGVCDREPLMARQLFERFPIQRHFTDVATLIDEARPDVVHVTTPPESHLALARYCLERGCHVYVEKPFTVNLRDAQVLVALAEKRGRRLTVGHDDQFGHAARRMRDLVRRGYLGGTPVHMESTFCYDLSDPAYARALLADTGHWVRRLPGGLWQNVVSHGIARIAEFLAGDAPRVIAHGFVSPRLRGLGEADLIDELRVIISDAEGTTAYFTFSSQMRPSLHQFRIYGPANGLVLDQDQETLIRLRGGRFKSYAESVLPQVVFARQYLAGAVTNVGTFLGRDFHMKSGMKYLIEAFYRSIAEGMPVPIPYREILLTAAIMDAIVHQLAATGRPALGEAARRGLAAEPSSATAGQSA